MTSWAGKWLGYSLPAYPVSCELDFSIALANHIVLHMQTFPELHPQWPQPPSQTRCTERNRICKWPTGSNQILQNLHELSLTAVCEGSLNVQGVRRTSSLNKIERLKMNQFRGRLRKHSSPNGSQLGLLAPEGLMAVEG